jgi:hypothetical protein
MVATAGTVLFFVLVCCSDRFAGISNISRDFGVRVDGNVRLL